MTEVRLPYPPNPLTTFMWHGSIDRSLHVVVAAVAFWYKPSSSHKHLYPALKDAAGKPIESIVDGEITYTPDPHGIEVFSNASGPDGVPTLAPFARGVADAEQARFDVVAAQAHVKAIIKALPETFPAADIACWERFFEAYPANVEAIPQDRLHPIRLDAIPPTATRAVQSSLAAHQVIRMQAT